MYRSAVLLFFMASCATALPVLFFSFEDKDTQNGQSKMIECDPPINGVSHRCRYSSKTPEALGLRQHEVPLLQITEEKPENEITVVEIEEYAPEEINNLFQTSKLIENTKYKVEARSGNRNQGGCADGEVFIGELDLCMPYTPVKSSAVNDDDDDDEIEVELHDPTFEIIQVGYSKKDCKAGQIHNPSTGVCMDVNNCWPHKNCDEYHKEQAEREAAALKDDDDEEIEIEVHDPTFEIIQVGYSKNDCKAGQIHNPSTGVCMDVNNCWPHKNCDEYHKEQAEREAAAIKDDDDDDDEIEIEVHDPTFEIIQVGYSRNDCKAGQIHNPSTGVCMDVNNCWPHKNCEEYHKEQAEKAKERDNQDDD